MDKLAVIDEVIKALQHEIDIGSKASREAFEAATDEDSYSDGKYDTRSLEASYLAGGQAQIVKELGDALQGFNLMKAQHFITPPSQQIGLGSLVEIKGSNSNTCYIVGPGGGGMDIEVNGTAITVLTLHSPLGLSLASKREGDEVEMPESTATVLQVL